MSTPLDRADGSETARIREARDAKPQRRAGTPAGPATPPAGPAGHTSPPAPLRTPPFPVPEGTQTPAGGPQRAVSAPLAGQAWVKAAKAAQSAHNAEQVRGRFTRAAKKTGPGMIRKPPPGGAA